MPLMTFADVTAQSRTYAGQTYAQRALVRIQDNNAPMPPTGARVSATDIQTFAAWVNAGSPMGVACGGSPTGAGGSTGAGGRGGTGGTAAPPPPPPNGTVPCDVQAVFAGHCTSCHGTTLAGGAPMSLVTYQNLRTISFADAGMTFAQRTVVRMQATTNPMPPTGTRVVAAEIQTVNNWISAGYPSGTGTCMIVQDPLTLPSRCTSNTRWTGGNNGSSNMNPGRACPTCHAGEEDAPRFSIAGTLYPTGHEPDLCNGVNGSSTGARVIITDAANRTITLTPNGVGNFTSTTGVTFPIRARVTYQGRERAMGAAQNTGNCNSCHTQNGANGAPGRITLP